MTRLETNSWYLAPQGFFFDVRPYFNFWWGGNAAHDPLAPGQFYVVDMARQAGGAIVSKKPYQVAPGQPAPVLGSVFLLRDTDKIDSLWTAVRFA